MPACLCSATNFPKNHDDGYANSLHSPQVVSLPFRGVSPGVSPGGRPIETCTMFCLLIRLNLLPRKTIGTSALKSRGHREADCYEETPSALAPPGRESLAGASVMNLGFTGQLAGS
jgi:hypothetical protein